MTARDNEGAAAPQTARKRGRPTAAERAQRRDEILDAAVRLFVAGGFEQVTLDDIAARAHVTKRTIYAYVGDRTEIFLAAVERLRERALEQPVREDGLVDLAAKIVFALHGDEAVGLHRLMITEAHRFPDLARRFYDDGPRGYVAALADRLTPPDPETAEALFALLLGEPHRRRLLGLAPAPTRQAAAAHARSAVGRLVRPVPPEGPAA
ncbi:putative TetR family transcriptional regulator [Actinacidiphila reveromycinica]|uniref:Putative TetR family transcriptional regulator n=1 Tax=Actinacidiphila reveromycinica TaxID=659352 RepID=A0A7U3UPT1_9ACTN|nr:TetR/AcrR family transcriptional regulator [Streptomyces sp. SN-593]BBA96421.1 putative TetR family transcriptional regulator [Streptomyces sp. SN-593]